jgi:hypothetical protein
MEASFDYQINSIYYSLFKVLPNSIILAANRAA